MNKDLQLKKVAGQIAGCKICKEGKSGLPVPGEGSGAAKIVFIGEAPGKKEAATGRPFVGRSGALLRLLIREAGLKENDVYITSPVKYLPDRGTPSRGDIIHGKTHLDKQLAIIDPKLLVLLGSVASLAVLDSKVAVIKEHGKIVEREGRRYFITLHPAAALRFPPLRKLLKEDFEKLKSHLKKLR